MLACRRNSNLFKQALLGLLAALLMGGAGAAAMAQAPKRVVSINLCSDQLAMILADPGQLISVSDVSLDKRVSPLADHAATLHINYGRAEEIYLLRPDLVLAGQYSNRVTLGMLSRLGVPVVTIPPARSLEDVRANMRRIGRALGREEETETEIAAFDARLAALAPTGEERPIAAYYAANGYTLGTGSLGGDVLRAAGLRNLAAEAGLSLGGVLPLELLVLSSPDLVITSEAYPGASRAEEILSHPALLALTDGQRHLQTGDRDWICGTPYVLSAVEALGEARQTIMMGGQ